MTSNEAVLAHARAIEALLFVAGEPTSISDLARILSCEADQVIAALGELETSLRDGERGVRLLRVDDRAQLVTASEHAALVEAFQKSGMREQLTPAAAETLAIVAYRGPIHRAGIEAIRGVNSSFSLRLLAIRGLIERTPNPKDSRVMLYSLSPQFFREMGLSRIEDLPDYEALRVHEGMIALEKSADATMKTGENQAESES